MHTLTYRNNMFGNKDYRGILTLKPLPPKNITKNSDSCGHTTECTCDTCLNDRLNGCWKSHSDSGCTQCSFKLCICYDCRYERKKSKYRSIPCTEDQFCGCKNCEHHSNCYCEMCQEVDMHREEMHYQAIEYAEERDRERKT